ncbi:protein claret segregational-like [Phymastichus coffea]|uniref:protein claret segregational-like n=1 Tax=Phymastichus coffea TaxID=108790 RepID=UPI00273B4270|nr:protein claret segregational-like [Phymastichus coffea]XP_058806810.1 protein claret segregational-like [Phymastichus coffea]
MESRLPKLNFQFKVPARTANGNSTVESLKSFIASTSTESVKMNKDSSNMKNKTATNISAKVIDENKAKTIDENKAPITRMKATAIKNNITMARGAQKRPALTNNVTVEAKRANLKTTMKSIVRPVRPTTSVGPIGNRARPTTTASAAAAVNKSAAPKLNKWDFKGRFEHANIELSALKQKHKDLTLQYTSMQEEMDSLRESESSNRLKAEKLEVAATELAKEVDKLQSKINELEQERNRLAKDLQESKKLYDETSSSLEQHKSDLNIKAVLIADQHTELTNLKSKLQEIETKNSELTTLVLNLDKDRRVLHNTIQEMKGNIRVFCRVRPKIPKESSKSTCFINYLDECTLEVGKADEASMKMKSQRQEFSFDKVFPPTASQADIFEELSMLVQSALEGYNVCVFAYGQTGSGKTYTMEGFPGTDNEGMIPRTVKHIFNEMKQFELLGWEYKIEASFLEIYNEQIVDLLDNTKKNHDIRMADSKGSDLYVSNLLVQEINSPEELNQCLEIAQENRAIAATQSNERSSRSHSVARIRLIGTHKEKQEICIGNLNLVDLAGSERLKNEEAARIAETKNINKSLANLGHVILALLQKQDHIPYRNSKLTHLLMPSLGGNSKTLMLLNISPLEESYNETLNSLRFGFNVNSCKTGTIKKVKTVL